MNVNLDVEAGAKHVLTNKTTRSCFSDFLIEPACAVGEFAANIDIGHIRANRKRADHDAFDQLMRIVVNHLVIVERAGFAFVGVHHKVFGIEFFGDKAPFYARRKARAAASAQARFFDFIHNRLLSHRRDRSPRRVVAAVGNVHIQIGNIRNFAVA